MAKKWMERGIPKDEIVKKIPIFRNISQAKAQKGGGHKRRGVIAHTLLSLH